MNGISPSRLLMFDLDGTLIDSREDLCTAVNLMRADYELPPLPVLVASSFIGDGIHKLVERALRGHPADLDEAVKKTGLHYHHHFHDRTILYPGVKDGLKQLVEKGYLTALITNKPADFSREIIAYFGIDSFFSLVLGGGDTEHMKPHPQPLLLAMEKLNANPQDSWMIGDHQTDLQAARHAGISSVFLTYGIGLQGNETPTRIFDSFSKLVEFFRAR